MGMALDPQESSSRLTELERKALEIIKSRGDEGIYQNELWKILGIDSREGSRLALRLLKKGLIIREPVIHNGRRTYRLVLAKPVRVRFKLRVNLDTVINIPCFVCPHLERCHTGGFYDPRTCPVLNQWLEERARELRLKLKEFDGDRTASANVRQATT